jgi:hypothetical protein
LECAASIEASTYASWVSGVSTVSAKDSRNSNASFGSAKVVSRQKPIHAMSLHTLILLCNTDTDLDEVELVDVFLERRDELSEEIDLVLSGGGFRNYLLDREGELMP